MNVTDHQLQMVWLGGRFKTHVELPFYTCPGSSLIHFVCIGVASPQMVAPCVLEHICEQASYNLYYIDRAKLFTENLAMARLTKDQWASVAS